MNLEEMQALFDKYNLLYIKPTHKDAFIGYTDDGTFIANFIMFTYKNADMNYVKKLEEEIQVFNDNIKNKLNDLHDVAVTESPKVKEKSYTINFNITINNNEDLTENIIKDITSLLRNSGR